jgi:hypothetical protein
MPDNLFPTTIAGFTGYFKIAMSKVESNMANYKIFPERLAAIMPYYTAYMQAEALAANPDTATTGARRARDKARKALEPLWRAFLNENIRHNSLVPAADLEVFRVKKRDTTRTPPGVPENIPVISVRHAGARRLEVDVIDGETGKKKKPRHVAGSFIYVAITAAGETPGHADEYRKQDFSSNCHHLLEFPLEQLAKQANIFARYANPQGKEGPASAVEPVIIA